jgi:ankyrin repeat protein
LQDSKHGRTPLSWAAENGYDAITRQLLGIGKVEVDSKDDTGRTPLSLAAENGHKASVKLLLATGNTNVDANDNYGRTPLFTLFESTVC